VDRKHPLKQNQRESSSRGVRWGFCQQFDTPGAHDVVNQKSKHNTGQWAAHGRTDYAKDGTQYMVVQTGEVGQRKRMVREKATSNTLLPDSADDSGFEVFEQERAELGDIAGTESDHEVSGADRLSN